MKINLPNILSFSRMFFAVVFMYIAYLQLKYENIILAGIFIIAAATDGLDGYFARKYNQSTDFGKKIDLLADKVLVISVLLYIMYFTSSLIFYWSAFLIILREVLQIAIRNFMARFEITMEVNYLGKIKTVIQMLAIIFLILSLRDDASAIGTFGKLLIFASVLISYISFWVYVNKAIENFNKKFDSLDRL